MRLRPPVPHKKPRPPLATFQQCAERLGLTIPALRSYFANHPGRPEPKTLDGLQTFAISNARRQRYYDFAEVKRWFDSLPKKGDGNA